LWCKGGGAGVIRDIIQQKSTLRGAISWLE